MAALSFFTCTGTYLAAVQDSIYDVDNDPELTPMSGTVTFTPLIDTGDSLPAPTLTPPANVWLVPIKAQIKAGVITSNGATGIKLVANTAVLALSGNLFYRVDFYDGLLAGGKTYHPDSFTFQAPTSATTLDLVSVTPVAGQPAQGSGGGAVTSVAGRTGAIVLTAADINAGGSPSATTFLRGDNTWATPAGGGGGAVSSVAGRTGAVTLTADDTPDGTTNKAFTAAEKSKLAAISGSNTGDQTIPTSLPPTDGSVTAAKINAATLVTAAETIAANNNDTTLPTSAAVSGAITTAVNGLLNGAPGALDTLKELADAINDDASFAATITTALGGKVSRTSTPLQMYGTDGSGAQITGTYSDAATTNTLALRGTGGTLAVGDATLAGHAATKSQVDAADALKAPLASPTFTGTVAGVTKAMVGLGNVDNTADASKPVSTAQAAADAAVLSAALAAITAATPDLGPAVIRSVSLIIPTAANSDYSFPARARGWDPYRKRCVIRNVGTVSFDVGFGSAVAADQAGYGNSVWTSAVTVPVGSEYLDFSERELWIRPSSGTATDLMARVETELGVS